MAPCLSSVLIPVGVWLSLASRFVTGQNAAVGNLRYSILEELPSGVSVGNIVTGADLTSHYSRDDLRAFTYKLLDSDSARFFQVSKTSWMRAELVTSSVAVDRDSLCPQKLDCLVSVNVAIFRGTEFIEVFIVDITVLDTNDNSPRFPDDALEITISEKALPGMQFVVPSAYDPDSGLYGVQTYEFTDMSDKFRLTINNNTDGSVDLRLILMRALDREDEAVYNMQLRAYDASEGGSRNSGSLQISVLVEDANDNTPLFSKALYEVTLTEDAPVNSPFIQVYATDEDIGLNGDVIYGFSQQTATLFGNAFGINSSTGEIFPKIPLDFETHDSYTLVVTARDKGPSSVPANAKVIVTVLNINDHPPRIQVRAGSGSPEVHENQPAGSIAVVTVEDDDEVECIVPGPYFAVEKLRIRNMFKLVTKRVFDRETRDVYSLTLTCQDQGQPPLSASEEVSVRIVDENDNAPVFTEENLTRSIRENNARQTALLRVSATDRDDGKNAEISYYLHTDAKGLVTIDTVTGDITTNHVFDHENITQFQFHVIARDHGNQTQSSMATVTLNIIDINDEAPIFNLSSFNFGTFENQEAGTEIGTIVATDPDDAPFNSFRFELDRASRDRDAFRIDGRTGVITTNKILNREHQSAHYLVVLAKDTASPYPSSSVSVTIYVADKNDNAPKFVFPKPINNTVEVSSFAHQGHVFSKVTATDDDLGNNARVEYSIGKGNEEGYFDIDPNTGVLSCGVDLDTALEDVYHLTIIAEDSGDSPKEAFAMLSIVINRSIEFANANSLPRKDEETGLGFHHRIIIILGCVTAVLVAILVTAIVCIRRKQIRQERESYKYTCRVDMANRIAGGTPDGTPEIQVEATQDDVKDPPPDISGPPPHYGALGYEDSNPDILRMHDMSGSSAEGSDTRLTFDRSHSPGGHESGVTRYGVGGGTMRRGDIAYSPTSAPWPSSNQHQHVPPRMTNQQVEVHKLLDILKTDGSQHDSDSTSGCSADMSNSDSGRFHTEEGGDLHPIVPLRTPHSYPSVHPRSSNHQRVPYNNLSSPTDNNTVPIVTKTNINFSKCDNEPTNKCCHGRQDSNEFPSPGTQGNRQKPVPPQRKQGTSLQRKQNAHVTFEDNLLHPARPEMATFKNNSLSPRRNQPDVGKAPQSSPRLLVTGSTVRSVDV